MKRNLKRGDIFELEDGHTVYTDVPEHFVFSNRKGDFHLVHHEVRVGKHEAVECQWLDTSFLIGRYKVVATDVSGGGTGHGCNDVYADGHHVFCEKQRDRDSLYERDIFVDFYQDGSFTAMIKPAEITLDPSIEE